MPVFEAFDPDKTNSAKFPVKPVEVDERYNPFPEVKELALMVKKVSVVADELKVVV